MNEITVFQCKGQWVGFESSGHVGESDEEQGVYSLVCCALSMHLQTIAATLEKSLEKVEIKQDNGYLKVFFTSRNSKALEGIEATFKVGLDLLKEAYTSYLIIHNEEVESHD